MSKTLFASIVRRIRTTAMAGASRGIVIRQKPRHALAPSMRAAPARRRDGLQPGDEEGNAGVLPDVGDDDHVQRQERRPEPLDQTEMPMVSSSPLSAPYWPL